LKVTVLCFKYFASISSFKVSNQSFFADMIGNPLYDLENNLPDELFSTSGGSWGATTASVNQQPPTQQQHVQRSQAISQSNQGMGMQMGMGPGPQQQNGTMDSQHHHQLSHMTMSNKASMNNMSGGAISGSAIVGPNNMNMVKGPHNSKLNSPPGGAPMMQQQLGNSMGNGPQMMNMQQQGINNMLNPGGGANSGMGVNMSGINSGNVQMKTPVSMMNAGQMGQPMHNGPQSMMQANARPVAMPNNMMQQQAPLRGQLLQGMNPQGARLQVLLQFNLKTDFFLHHLPLFEVWKVVVYFLDSEAKC